MQIHSFDPTMSRMSHMTCQTVHVLPPPHPQRFEHAGVSRQSILSPLVHASWHPPMSVFFRSVVQHAVAIKKGQERLEERLGTEMFKKGAGKISADGENDTRTVSCGGPLG